MPKQTERRKTLVLEELSKGQGINNIKYIRRRVSTEARKQIDFIVDSVNTRDNLAPDAAIKAISTLISLYLIEIEMEIDENDRVRIKRWFPIKEDTY